MVETICLPINYVKRMPNGSIQFRNAIKFCKVFRVNLVSYKKLSLLYMLALHIITNAYLCSECAASIGFTCQLPGIHRTTETTWKDHGFGSSSRWTSFSWLPGTWVRILILSPYCFYSDVAYKHGHILLCCLFSLLALQMVQSLWLFHSCFGTCNARYVLPVHMIM